MRRLPNMSPRPAIGVQIAETRRVAVITRAVSSGLAPRSSGSAPWMGIRMVCWNDALAPANASTPTMRRWCAREGSAWSPGGPLTIMKTRAGLAQW